MSVSDIVDWVGLSNNSPQVKPTTLPVSYFKFPPSPAPTAVPPPTGNPTLAHPFTIPTDIYNYLLSAHVPITFALVYMSLASLLNQVNANRNHKPWAISRTRVFKFLVVLHNIFLAVYSAWTCIGMINAVRLSIPAWNEDWQAAKTVDALCKLHGPRGAGNAATYNATTNAWTMTNRLFHLAADGLGPESTDVGRIWNDGLAFYGWLFYLSKFYEVVDTFIILAKGRKSSLLQTYHHAGAMLSMWAGIRYMSPPIWMFVLVNSGIHAIMYSFYLLSTLGFKVPRWSKQTLTTLQITQFLVGTIYAFLHLFVAYQIPISVPYVFHLGEGASRAASEAPTQVSSIATAVSSAANVGAWLKKLALRGAGYEGLAENVLNDYGKPFGVDAVHIVEDAIRREETRYKDELQWVHCLDTSGQVFAILLNCIYLLPLTWLFVQFFITAYFSQTERRKSRSASDAAIAAKKSFFDATKGVSRQLSDAVEEMHSVSQDIGDDDAVFVDGAEIKREMQEEAEKIMGTLKQGQEKVRQKFNDIGVSPEAIKQEFQRDMEAARKTLNDSTEKVKNAAANATDPETREKLAAKAQAMKDSVNEAVENAMENVKSAAMNVKDQTQPAVDYASEKAADLKEQAGPAAQYTADKAGELKDRAVVAVQDVASQAKKSAPEKAELTRDSANKTSDIAKDTAQKTGDQLKESAQHGKETAQKTGDKAKSSAQQSMGTGEATVEGAKSKADDLSRKIDQNSEEGAKSKGEKQSEVEKFTSESAPQSSKETPNGSGTSGAEGSKKEADKIIDESQVVRDEDVNTEEGANSENKSDDTEK